MKIKKKAETNTEDLSDDMGPQSGDEESASETEDEGEDETEDEDETETEDEDEDEDETEDEDEGEGESESLDDELKSLEFSVRRELSRGNIDNAEQRIKGTESWLKTNLKSLTNDSAEKALTKLEMLEAMIASKKTALKQSTTPPKHSEQKPPKKKQSKKKANPKSEVGQKASQDQPQGGGREQPQKKIRLL